MLGTDDMMGNEEKPNLVLKPRVIVTFVPVFLLVFFLLWIPYFLVNVFAPLLGIGGLITPWFYDPLLSFLAQSVAFFLLPLIGLIAHYKNLKSREYRFFRERLEFYKGFWTKEKVTARYEKITDVFMKKSAWQRMWGVGSVVIRTAKSGPEGKIQIRYVPQTEEAYRRLQEMIKMVAR
jgi:membrane protein YdbS with pleckstrin-like domain